MSGLPAPAPPTSVDLPQTSLWFNLAVSAARYPDKTAVVYFERNLRYSELRENCEALAGWLQHVAGVKPGDRVALMMQNCPQWIVACYAILRADAVVVPVNPMNQAAELQHLLGDAGVVAAVCATALAPRLADAVRSLKSSAFLPVVTTDYDDMLDHHTVDEAVDIPAWVFERSPATPGSTPWAEALRQGRTEPPRIPGAGPQDMAFLPYTSGTTGLPKGCVHLHRTVMHNIAANAVWTGGGPRIVALSSLPLFHVAGMLAGMHNPIFLGATAVMLPRWDRDAAAALISRHRVTNWSCITTMMIDFLEHPQLEALDLSSLEHLGGGGAAMPASVAKRLKDRLGIDYTEGYGLTETMGATHRNPRGRSKQQCLGVPFVGTYARVIDPDTLAELPPGEQGEIVVDGPQVFTGYWRNEAATREAFVALPDGRRCFRTGDLGHVDAEGYYFLTDRLKRMINAAGFKVWPAEVEAMMYEHPAVREACVISRHDLRRGETVKAVVVLRETADPGLREQDIVDWARTRMSAYKAPRIVEFVHSLPRSHAGKVMWRELQQREDLTQAASTGAANEECP